MLVEIDVEVGVKQALALVSQVISRRRSVKSPIGKFLELPVPITPENRGSTNATV